MSSFGAMGVANFASSRPRFVSEGDSSGRRRTERCLLAFGGLTESSELVRWRRRVLRPPALGTNIFNMYASCSREHTLADESFEDC